MFYTSDLTTLDIFTCLETIAVDFTDDLGLLCEAISPGRYDLHFQSAIKKSYGAIFLILRGLSSRRVNIM